MKKIEKDYILGLDIGTNSCGWAVTDKKNNLLKLRGKTAIGVRLFEEGHSAANRRSFRTTRRRLKRRKWRLKLLEEIFAEPMAEVDPYFFARLRESWVSPLDKKRKKYTAIVYPTPEEDAAFYKQYPTIYHLRQALMTEDRQFDLREIYIAMHHIIKYRGNFLQDTSVKDFNASTIEVEPVLEALNNSFSDLAEEQEDEIELKTANAAEIEAVIKGKDTEKTIYKADKVKKIANLLTDSTSKVDKNVARQIANAIMGYKAQFETILGKDIDKNDKSGWELKLSDADADDKLEALLPELEEPEQTIIAEIRKLFSAITLSTIVDEGKTLSASMVAKYKQHAKDYQLLKAVIKSQKDKQKAQNLRLAYDLYVNNRHGKLLAAKKELKAKGVLTKDEFYKAVEDNVDESAAAKQILQKIELDSFMPKQRTSSNRVIPFQLHQIELDQIIANQGKYYPFLAEVNPLTEHRKQAPYKLDELVRFRVPYYVGPMITADDQKKTSGKSFAWMVRKEAGNITPWNFEEKVNREESANKFIKRMTLKDTYLLGEDVIPANSLLYQRFTVLNELNNIRVNGKRLDPLVKQKAYKDLFEKNKTVTAKKFAAWIETNYGPGEITGLADPEKFNSSLSSYYHLRNLQVFANELDSADYQKDIEKIIEWSTVFEDKKIYQEKLHEIGWLRKEQFKAISTWRLQGWGRLSRKLLVELHDKNDQNIMNQLWDSQKNFMQIVTEPDFKEAIEKENQAIVKKNGVEDILADAYTSPANKKAIRQVVKVVDDVVKAAHGKEPAQFAIEFTREPEKDLNLSQVRGDKLLKIYQNAAKELVDKDLTNNLKKAMNSRKLVQDKYFLYFIQGGRDAYTGEKINIDEIESRYDIDHILPQSFVKDDSFDNKVLTAKSLKENKTDDVPFEKFGKNQVEDLKINVKDLWKKWQHLSLINQYKLNNLLFNPENKNYNKRGFINRQLVETSQLIKLVATILQNKYKDSEIITTKPMYNTALRERLSLYKKREVNDYYHAIDAYLSAICGNFLYQVYPKLRPFFVYGQFQKFSNDPDLEKNTIKNVKSFNFLWPLLQKSNFERKSPEIIYDSSKRHLIFFKHKDIFDKLRRAYNFKYILVSRETTTLDQEMFKMTIYPRLDRDLAKRRNLISKGQKLSTEIYGGYSGNVDTYMAIVKIIKSKTYTYKIVGVPMRALTDLRKAKKHGSYNETLKKILAPTIERDRNGNEKKNIKGFEIVRGLVPYKQLIIDGNLKFILGSASYMYNAKELTLSQETMRILTDNFEENENQDSLLIEAYDEIVEKTNKYVELFDKNNFRKGLNEGRENFVALTSKEKKETISKILQGMHDDSVAVDLKKLGIKTPFGKIQSPSGIILSPNAILIMQSSTGLFQKKVKVSNFAI